ncbi:MAG: low molecular weight phosphatase family protein, partial [Thermoplasmata archaeon]
PPGWHAISAGTRPAPAPNRRTGPMLQEIGLAPPVHPPQVLRTEDFDRASVRVTMGCLDDASCPTHLRSLELRDWNLEDPATLDDEGFRRVRGRILDLVRDLRTELVRSDGRRADIPDRDRR